MASPIRLRSLPIVGGKQSPELCYSALLADERLSDQDGARPGCGSGTKPSKDREHWHTADRGPHQ
jgi:hypothetical protein